MGNTINTNNSSMYDLYKVGNASSYAKTTVNSFLKDSGGVGSMTSSSVNNFLNSFTGTKNNTVKSTMGFARENTSNLLLLKSASAGLAGAAKKIGTGTLQSSDKSVVTANASYASSFNPSFKIDVQNTATAQKSSSAALNSSAASVFDKGQNSLMLETDKGSYQIDFSVKDGETNQESLNKIAQSINDSKADVSASVVTKDGKSELQLASKTTGDLSAFEISASGGKTAAEKLDMRQTQKATDANYSINGQKFSSAKNEVSIPEGRGATMTLQGAGTANLTRATDASGVVAAAQNFATAYNATVNHLISGSADGAGVSKALNLVTDNRITQGSASGYGGAGSARLSALGITVDQDGNMQVNAEKLTAAVQENPNVVKDALSGYNSLADLTSKNADEAMRIPSATYTNFSNMQVQNSLIDTLMPRVGFLFDIGM